MKPQTRWSAALLLVAALAVLHSSLAEAESTSPGKNAVFASESGELDFIELLATIQTGKRNQVLKMDVFYTLGGGSCGTASQACISVVTVNQMSVEPSSSGGCAPCTALGCTVSGSFWFDIDASGQAGQPLDVRVVLADGGIQCLRTMSGSLSAVLLKK